MEMTPPGNVMGCGTNCLKKIDTDSYSLATSIPSPTADRILDSGGRCPDMLIPVLSIMAVLTHGHEVFMSICPAFRTRNYVMNLQILPLFFLSANLARVDTHALPGVGIYTTRAGTFS
jgi:hypothetical protein